MSIIQDNFQMPADAILRKKGKGRYPKYPFSQLEVGQGFTVTGDEKLLSSASALLSNFRNKRPTVEIKVGRTEGALHFVREA